MGARTRAPGQAPVIVTKTFSGCIFSFSGEIFVVDFLRSRF